MYCQIILSGLPSCGIMPSSSQSTSSILCVRARARKGFRSSIAFFASFSMSWLVSPAAWNDLSKATLSAGGFLFADVERLKCLYLSWVDLHTPSLAYDTVGSPTVGTFSALLSQLHNLCTDLDSAEDCPFGEIDTDLGIASARSRRRVDENMFCRSRTTPESSFVDSLCEIPVEPVEWHRNDPHKLRVLPHKSRKCHPWLRCRGEDPAAHKSWVSVLDPDHTSPYRILPPPRS